MADESKQKKVKPEPVVATQQSYVGPTIPRLGLVQYQVYIGGYPQSVTDLPAEQGAALQRMFVSLAEVANVMATINCKGSAYYALYQEAMRVRKELN